MTAMSNDNEILYSMALTRQLRLNSAQQQLLVRQMGSARSSSASSQLPLAFAPGASWASWRTP